MAINLVLVQRSVGHEKLKPMGYGFELEPSNKFIIFIFTQCRIGFVLFQRSK